MLSQKQLAEIGLDTSKNNYFNVVDKEHSGALKKFDDEELEAILHKDSCQTQVELAESLGVDHITVSKCLKALGMIMLLRSKNIRCHINQRRDVEWHFVTCEQLLQWQKRKDFLHHIITGDKKWIYYDNPKHRRP